MAMRLLLRCTVFLAFTLFAFVLAGCGGGSGGSLNSFPVTTTISSTGGSLTDGAATLTIPANAVPQPTLVSIRTATGYPSDSRLVAGTAFLFDANGTTFLQAAQISIQYSTANLPQGAVETSLSLFQLVNNTWTQVAGSTVDTANKVVSGSVTTLGIFAVFATVINGGSTTSARITFTSDRLASAPTIDLYTMKADGTGVQQLTHLYEGESVDTAFYKPDGSQIVYSKPTSGGADIDIMNADGTGQQLLYGNNTKPGGIRARNHNPEFSADGSKIVFASDATGSDEVYVMKPDGSGVTQLTTNFSFAQGDGIKQVSFTPSGQIRFVVTTGGATQYYGLNADGSNLTLLNSNAVNFTPWWSYDPKGKTIVSAQSGSSGFDLFTTKSDGTGATQMTHLNATSISKARFTQDGSKIVFDASVSGGQRQIYSLNPDGSNLQNLTGSTSNNYLQDAH